VEKTIKESTALDSFDSIEEFTLQIRREMFPNLQKEILREAQEEHKEKRV
jgi:hypothetical protein